jgi:hypothetical protein
MPAFSFLQRRTEGAQSRTSRGACAAETFPLRPGTLGHPLGHHEPWPRDRPPEE